MSLVRETMFDHGYVREAHARFEAMQARLNGDEHRIGTDGPHPITSVREKAGGHRG